MGNLLSNNLFQRVTVALIGAPLILYCTYLGTYYFAGFVFFISVLMLYEMNILLDQGRGRKIPILAIIFCFLCQAEFFKFGGENFLFIMIAYLAVVLLNATFNTRFSSVGQISGDALLFMYAGVFPGTLILLREYALKGVIPYDKAGLFVILFFITVWLVDTAAYFSGRFFGMHKFFPRISPKKTWEGAVGGFLGGAVAAMVFRSIFLPELPLVYAVTVFLLCGTVGQVGDLVESRFKRLAGIKDSSHILPGHGGFLDRFDGLIFTAPVLYVIFTLFYKFGFYFNA